VKRATTNNTNNTNKDKEGEERKKEGEARPPSPSFVFSLFIRVIRVIRGSSLFGAGFVVSGGVLYNGPAGPAAQPFGRRRP
jgi:hypothetical protein